RDSLGFTTASGQGRRPLPQAKRVPERGGSLNRKGTAVYARGHLGQARVAEQRLRGGGDLIATAILGAVSVATSPKRQRGGSVPPRGASGLCPGSPGPRSALALV